MDKRKQKTEITKKRILSAAEEEFTLYGFFGARVDRIAENSGVNKRMIYQHFESKDNLYKVVLLGIYEKSAECEKNFIIENADPVRAIKNIVQSYFNFLDEHPEFVRMLMWENLNGARSLPRDDLQRIKSPAIDYIGKVVKEGKRIGVFKEDADEYQITLSLMNFGFAYFSNIYTLSVMLERNLKNKEEIEKRANFMSGILLESLIK